MQHLQPGTTLQGGKYRIERVLGQGGFGITYLAEQTSLQRKVAIKEFFMKDFCSRDEATLTMSTPSTGSSKLVEQYRKKFIKEARNLARLNHPNIISVIDVFEENDTVYYVMPYLSGGSLQDYVKAHGALPESMAMKYVKQIAGALKYMHEEQHICHYDVKPANILLDNKGNAVLIDFGISKNYDAQGQETTTTPIGMSEGYAPIEQYQQNVEEFSPVSDVYALGATLYFLLHGKRPVSAVHRASGTSLLMSKNLSSGIRRIINTSMKVSVQERAQSMDVFIGNNKKPSKGRYLFITGLLIVLLLILFIYRPKETSTNTSLNPIINGIVNNMVLVEGGTFDMGATEEQGRDAYNTEKPMHRVTLNDFYLNKYEVTQEEWETVMSNNPSENKGEKNPVEMVSWEDCQIFINKLDSITGKCYRLPTEAEWEYAARGGKRSQHYKYAGGNNLDEVSWYNNNSNSSTHPVGQKTPNELGLYDMSGNVWEWCQDWYGKYSNESQTNPCSTISSASRVNRGGGFLSIPRDCRSANRDRNTLTFKSNRLGLRLAIDKE